MATNEFCPTDVPSIRAWVAFNLGIAPSKLELISSYDHVQTYKHPTMGRIESRGNRIRVDGETGELILSGQDPELVHAFYEGYKGGRKPSIFHPVSRRFYDAGAKMRSLTV